MTLLDNSKNTLVQVHSYDFLEFRALCDEIMGTLCQAKALLSLLSEVDIFQRMETEILRHYFYALNTIIDGALITKDKIYQMIDQWEEDSREFGSSAVRDVEK